MNIMNIIEPGYMVTYRNGEKAIVLGKKNDLGKSFEDFYCEGNDWIAFCEGGGWMEISDKDNFRDEDDEWAIVTIADGKLSRGLHFDDCDRKIVFNNRVKKMTLKEIEEKLGYRIEIVE